MARPSNIHVGPRPPLNAEGSLTERMPDGRLRCRPCNYVNWDIPSHYFMFKRVRKVMKGARAKTLTRSPLEKKEAKELARLDKAVSVAKSKAVLAQSEALVGVGSSSGKPS